MKTDEKVFNEADVMDWIDFFGGYYQFHTAMTKYMLFGDVPLKLPDTQVDPAVLWQRCIMQFFSVSTGNLIVEGLKIKALRYAQ